MDIPVFKGNRVDNDDIVTGNVVFYPDGTVWIYNVMFDEGDNYTVDRHQVVIDSLVRIDTVEDKLLRKKYLHSLQERFKLENDIFYLNTQKEKMKNIMNCCHYTRKSAKDQRCRYGAACSGCGRWENE